MDAAELLTSRLGEPTCWLRGVRVESVAGRGVVSAVCSVRSGVRWNDDRWVEVGAGDLEVVVDTGGPVSVDVLESIRRCLRDWQHDEVELSYRGWGELGLLAAEDGTAVVLPPAA
ncbi:MAG: hypothetical protein S0880_19380 [Actinomycetota bacterium]|nr:hypothetical protein [Actinomycetota bacterium]